MQKSDIKTLGILLIFFAIIAGIVIFIVMQDKAKLGTSQAPTLIPDSDIRKVNDYQTFFTVKSIIEKYQRSLTNKDKAAIYNYLDDDYIKKHNINQYNVLDNTNNIDDKDQFLPYDMDLSEGTNVSTTFVKSYNYNEHDTIKTYYIINLDYQNKSFSILPLTNEEYKQYRTNFEPNKITQIEANEDNTLTKSVSTDLDVCALYLTSYKYYINFDPNAIYKKFVNSQFEDESQFIEYINQNKNKINSSYIKEYKNYLDQSRSNYVCVDNNNIKYTFYEYSIMNYSINID